jgi:uncharacterized protein YjbI with pentapeptide repeats
MASGKITGYYGFYSITAFIIYDLLGYYCGYYASKDNNDFMIIRTWGILMAAQNGTSFRGADLTDVIFEKAILNGTDFDNSRDKKTTLNKVIWKDVKGLDYANFASDSILINSAVRNLLVTRNGYGKSYVGANLQSANLDEVDLRNADLTRANISGATLREAKLINANLNESIVLNTDFTESDLTGACLEAWNFDSHTNLTNVKCQYVYLLRNEGERYPSSGEFFSGDFTKLFQKVIDTVDLIFHDDIDRQAVVSAIREVKVKYGNFEIKVCSVEEKNGLLIVRVNVPPDLNKEDFHRLTMELYRIKGQLLQANDEISYHRSKPGNIMINSGNNASNIVGGNGDIKGNINKINQLSDISDPNQPNIKELLIQLQTAIEAEPNLSGTDKSDLLEEVQNLAEATHTKEIAKKEKLGRKAKRIFDNMLEKLPDTAKIVEACSKILPVILKVLGVSG